MEGRLNQQWIIEFNRMKQKSKIISLSQWPTNSNQYHPTDRLSPLTQKILVTTKVDLEDIIPITIQQFIKLYQVQSEDNGSYASQYSEQMQLRSRRVQLLRSMWQKMNKKRLKITHRNSSAVQSKKYSLSKTFLKNRQVSPINGKKSKKSKSPSPLIFKATSRKKKLNTQYFNDYEYHRKQNSNTDESTKSKPTISVKNLPKKPLVPNDDYFQTKSRIKNRKHKGQKISKEEDKDKIMLELGKLMTKWSQLYEKHSQQDYEAEDLPEKERKRLQKMHEIEKKELKDQISFLSKKVSQKMKDKKF